MKKHMGILLVILGAVSFSGAGVLGKYTTWSGLSTAGARCLVAAIIMAIARGGVKVKLTKGNLLGAFGCAATSIVFIMANKLTTAANAIVLQYAMTAVVILFCWLFYGQRPGKKDVACAVSVLIGVVLCSASEMSGGRMIGNILALVSAVTYALVFFCARMPDADAESYNFMGIAMCVPCVLFAAKDPGATFTVGNILALSAMGVCLSVGYILISRGMKTVSPVSAAITTNIEPVLNPIWVFLFLGEAPNALAILGAIIVLGTVTLYSIPFKRKV